MKVATILCFAMALVGCGDPDESGNDDGSGSHNGGTAGSGAGVSGSAGSGDAGSSSGGAGSGSGGAGSGSGGTSSGGSSGASGACNTLEANAPDYPFNNVPDAAPAPTGGTIVDGTYFVTSVTWFESPLTGSSNTPGGIRIDITGSSWQEADGSPDDISPPVHFTSELEVQSPNVILTQTCPIAAGPDQYGYTADADTLTVFITDGAEIFGMNLTRQ
jgi:hypothetical protein